MESPSFAFGSKAESVFAEDTLCRIGKTVAVFDELDSAEMKKHLCRISKKGVLVYLFMVHSQQRKVKNKKEMSKNRKKRVGW